MKGLPIPVDPKPAIVSPVSRLIEVADHARSTLFYRDVLGFEIREETGVIEAVSGPARIEFAKPDQPPRPAIFFFQADDVEAMYAAIRARGGQPSELEKVNWIKMRMFEIRDPDGHTLWFGQSFDHPHAPGPSPMMLRALPQLPFNDVAAAVAYYRDVLGFRINYQQHDLGVMDRTERHTGIGSAYVYVENADALYTELHAKGANLEGEPVSHPWGLRDFAVQDLERNRIVFGQPFE
jgi:uncharacterized glyoxalase superfamily protein PhnB